MKPLNIHRYRGGARGTVVLLHGFLGDARDWDEAVSAWAADDRVVAVDLPGHGGSNGLPPGAYTLDGAADAVLAALDAQGIRDAALVGYSMGGRLALHVALREPKRWRALILESASPGIEDAAERGARRVVDEAWAGKLEAMPLRAFLDEWYGQPLFESLQADPARLRAVIERRAGGDPRELARALRGMSVGRQEPLWERLGALACPVLFVAGAEDARYAALTERMQRLCKGSRRVIVPNAGHNVHAEQPAAFAAAVSGYLGG